MAGEGATLQYLAKTYADDSRVTYDLASFYLERAATDVDQLDGLTGAALAQTRPIALRAMDLLNRAIPILERLEAMQPALLPGSAEENPSRLRRLLTLQAQA